MKFSFKKELKKTLATVVASVMAFSSISCMNVFAAGTDNLPAFPGAEGGGKFATGGRGGKVYHVTNLNDSGPGSFRDAVGGSNRIVVFDVSGTIELKSDVVVKDNVTVAGQTAPGGKGITLKNYKIGLGGNNIILRFISSRPGERGTSADYDAFGGAKGSNSIVDHCSIGWANDEQWGLYSNNTNQTVQWSLIGPANSFSYHSKGIHGFGIMFGKGQNSWHHNMIAHNISRNFRGKVEGTNVMDFVNNVVYDWGYQTVYGTLGHLNYAGNYFKAGSSTSGGYNYINFSSGTNVEKYKFYLTGNKMVNKDGSIRNSETNNWKAVNYGNVTSTYGYDEAYYRTDNYMPLLTNGIDVSVAPTMDTADVAFDKVTKYAGAGISENCKPKIDLEVMRDAINGTGSITGARPLSEASATQQAEIAKNNINFVDYSQYYPSAILKKEIVDSDNDGMPDDWEIARGLDPYDASDATGDYLGEGYNNIEYYINDLTVNAFPPGTVTLSKEIANSDYVTTNWKASENKSAYAELMEGLFAKDALVYTSLGTTIDKIKFDGYVTGIKSDAPLTFEPVYDGDYTVYYRIGSNKTFKIVDENGAVVGTKSNSGSDALETSTKVTVKAGKTYYAYVEGSNAYFYGVRFERLKTASPYNNYSEYKFDLTSDKGTNVYISDASQKAKIKPLSGFKYHSMGGYNASTGDILYLTLDGSGKYTNTNISFDLLYPTEASATAEIFDALDMSYSKSLAKANLTADGTNPVKLIFDGEGGHSYVVRVTSSSANYFLAKGLTVKTKTGLVEKTDTNTETTTETTTESIPEYEFNLTSDRGTNVNISDNSGKAYVKLLPSFRYHSMGGYDALVGDILSLSFAGSGTYKNTEIKFDFLYPSRAKGTATVYDINDTTKALASVTASADGVNPVSLKFDAAGGHSYIVKITSDSSSYFLVRKLAVETRGNLIESVEKEEIIEYNFNLTSDLGTNKVISDSTKKADIKVMPSFRYHSMGGYNALVGDILLLSFDGNKTHRDTIVEFDFLYPDKASGTATIYDMNDTTRALASVTASSDGKNPISLKFDAVGGHSYIIKITSDSASYFLVKGVNIKTGGKLIAADSYADKLEEDIQIVETGTTTEETTVETTETTTEETTEEITQSPSVNNKDISVDIVDSTIYVHAGETVSFDTIVNSSDNKYYFELNGGNWWFEPVDNFVNVWGGQSNVLTNMTNTFTINQWCGLDDGYEFTLTAYANDDNSVKDTATIVFCK